MSLVKNVDFILHETQLFYDVICFLNTVKEVLHPKEWNKLLVSFQRVYGLLFFLRLAYNKFLG